MQREEVLQQALEELTHHTESCRIVKGRHEMIWVT